MSEHSLRLLDAVRQRLAAARRRVVAADVLFGVVVTLGVLAALLALGAAVEAGVWMGTATRWAFVLAFGIVAVGLVGAFVVAPLLRLAGVLPGLDDDALARRIGRRYPEVADRLANLLDLGRGRTAPAPAPLLDGAVQMLGRQVEGVPFERVEDLRPAKRAAPVAAVPLVGLLLFGLIAPATLTGAVGRLFSPSEAFAPPAPFQLSVLPGDVELVRGGSLEVEAVAAGTSLPLAVTLEIGRVGEERTDALRLPAGDDGRFRHTEENVRESLRYRVVAEGIETPWYEARVVARPVVRGLRLTLRPPRYTGLPPQRLEPGVGDVTALPGTSVSVVATTDGATVDSAALAFASGRIEGLTMDGAQAEGAFTVRRDDAYRVSLQSRDGHANEDPILYTVQTLTDAPPQIRLLAPGDGALNEALQTRVAARVTDDFGFSRAALRFRLAERDGEPVEGDDFEALPISVAPRELDQEIGVPWLLRASGLDPRPGDAVAFFVEVFDNNAVAGYQRAQTPVFTLRFPSVREQYERLDETEDEAESGLEEMRDEAEDARERFEELRDELRRKQDADWEDQRQLESLMQQQEQLEENVSESVEQMQEVLEQMRENDLVSEQTMELYEELQRVVEEIADPELMEQLQKLQEAMQQLDLPEMMQAMEEFEFSEEQFRERLERALELFERLQTAKELEEAARRAEDIAEQEERLSEETGDLQEEQDSGELSEEQQAAEQERLAEEQERAQEAARELQEQMQQAQEQMEGMRNAPQEEMQEAIEQMEQVQEQMEQNQQQLQDGQLQDAQEGQQQMQQQMQQMSEQMQQMQQQMSGRQQQQNIAGLRRILDDVLTLSYEEEALRDRTAPQRPESPVLRRAAQQQVELAAGLATVADSLSALAREVPQMDRAIQQRTGEALREMGAATETLADRQPPQAAGHQKAAMTHLNDLALLLSDLLDQMMNSSSGGGGGGMPMQQMMQQLQQMSGQQQGLNQQLQQMLNDMQGQRLSIDQQGRLQQMQQQQEALRQQLQDLIEQGGENLDGQSRSELQRIAEEMEEAARQMEGGRITRETREQQERILTRLLEVRESMNQRGRKREREGQTGEDRPPETPPAEVAPPDEADRLRRDLIRALESGYAPDYQELIKRYFDLLQERSDGE